MRSSGEVRPWSHLLPRGVRADYNPPVGTLNELLRCSWANHPSRLAIDYYGEQWTYADLYARIAETAVALRARGIGRGDVIALYLPNTNWQPVWFLAVLAAGATVVNLSPLDAPRELAHKIADSGARWVVTANGDGYLSRISALQQRFSGLVSVTCDDAVTTPAAKLPDQTLRYADLIAEHKGAALPDVAVAPEDVALLQYTGGTTGEPKAAILSQRNIAAAVQSYSELFRSEPQFGPDQRVLVYTPLFHIFGLTTSLLRRLSEGASIYLRQRFDASEALDLIHEKRITAFGGVPTMWINLLQQPGLEDKDLSSINYAISGGAPLPVAVAGRVKELMGVNIRGGGGMTETSPVGINIPPMLPPGKDGTVGIPVPGIDVQIVAVDDPRRLLRPGEHGELRVRGPSVTRGYWKRPEETRAAFIDGWLMTGDIGYMDEDGYFYIVDRKKDMIVSSGFNVYPVAIEKAVHEHSAVADVAVIGIPDSYRGEAAKAFVVLREGAAEFSLEELREFLAERLGRHEMPQQLEFRSTLPRTAVGKTSRLELRAQEQERRATISN
ncbi:dicarboxylate--CoA ligase PimA [Aquamicrobium sp. LC103]|nr:dicarboxylate--CoA ligase PimA [Aquamicrobium sp. LC103]